MSHGPDDFMTHEERRAATEAFYRTAPVSPIAIAAADPVRLSPDEERERIRRLVESDDPDTEYLVQALGRSWLRKFKALKRLEAADALVTTLKAEVEELKRRPDMLKQLLDDANAAHFDATMRADEAESSLASLTGQVEDMRERAAKELRRLRDEHRSLGLREADGALQEAEAVIRSLPVLPTTGDGGGWRSIDETTQKGSVFLGWGAHMGMRVIDLDDEGHPWSDEGQHPVGAFTHWMPLPQAPTGRETSGEET